MALARLKLTFASCARYWPYLAAGMLAGAATPGMVAWQLTIPAFVFFFALALSGGGFLAGWLFGLAYFVTSLYWISYVVHVFGGVAAGLAWLPLAALAAYCACYSGLALWATQLMPRLPLALTLPLALVAFDVLRGEVMTGFPWNPWGVSLILSPALAAPAVWIGLYGLSFLLLCFCAGLAEVLLWLLRRRQPSWVLLLAPMTGLTWLLLILLAQPLISSNGQLASPIKIALVQGNINQDEKWSDEMRYMTIQIYEDLTRRATTSHQQVAMVVWPETAMPFFYQVPGPERDWVQRIAANAKTHLVFGAPAYEFAPENEAPTLYNRAYVLDASGQTLGYYDKTHLVPFGEYVPLQPLLFFVNKIVQGIGEFSPGAGRYVLQANEQAFGVLICYEAIFTFEVAEYAQRGARFLLQITNDAWFGNTAAPEQHLAMSQIRALETGLPLLRAANTGISAWVTPDGVVRGRLEMQQRDVLLAYVRPGSATPYAMAAGVWRWCWLSCAIVFSGLCAREQWQRRSAKRQQHTQKHI